MQYQYSTPVYYVGIRALSPTMGTSLLLYVLDVALKNAALVLPSYYEYASNKQKLLVVVLQGAMLRLSCAIGRNILIFSPLPDRDYLASASLGIPGLDSAFPSFPSSAPTEADCKDQ